MASKLISPRLIGAVAVTVVVVAGGIAVRATVEARPLPAANGPAAATQPERRSPAGLAASPPIRVSVAERPAVAILRDWDARRARAWSAGDEEALRDLYLPGSSAARRDTARLRSYRERGLTVRGMQRQMVDVRVLVVRPRLVRLRVTDRLVGAYVTDGVTNARLPWTTAATRTLTLRRVGADWLMGTVSAGDSALLSQ